MHFRLLLLRNCNRSCAEMFYCMLLLGCCRYCANVCHFMCEAQLHVSVASAKTDTAIGSNDECFCRFNFLPRSGFAHLPVQVFAVFAMWTASTLESARGLSRFAIKSFRATCVWCFVCCDQSRWASQFVISVCSQFIAMSNFE